MRRPLGALPLALTLVAAGCVPNRFYVPPPEDTATGSTSGELTTDLTTDGATTTGVDTSTTDPTTTTTTTTDPATTDVSTDTGNDTSTTGMACADMMTLKISGPGQIEDAFFVYNKDPMVANCDLYEAMDIAPCGTLNMGAYEAVKMVRKDTGPEVMYAMSYSIDEAVETLVLNGNTILGGKLAWTLYDISDDVTFSVGALDPTQTFTAGTGTGTQPGPGMIDATFDYRVNGANLTTWLNNDGPRGASTKVCSIPIPKGDYNDHPTVSCDLGPNEVDLVAAGAGVALYFDKGPAVLAGPIVKSTEAPVEYQPYLEIYFCPP